MISPYALLTASRPKSAASIVTPYDLYSAVQNREDMPSPPPESPASPAPDVSISQDLRHAASVLSKFYEELPVILTRLLTAGAAIIIGLLLLRLFRRLFVTSHMPFRYTAPGIQGGGGHLRSAVSGF